MERTVELVAVVCVLMSVLLTGCRSAQRTAAELAQATQTAWSNGDRATFIDLFVPRARERAEQVWIATQGLRIDSVTADAEVWSITWSVGETGQSTTSTVSAEVDCARGLCQLVDLSQARDAPAPAWITGDLVVARQDRLTVLSAPQASATILAAATEALDLVRSAPAALGLEPDTPVVIEVPLDASGFEQIMAAPEVDFRGSGAVTWTAGSDEGDPLIHVVVNPVTTAGATHQQMVRLLAHELVHVASSDLEVADGRHWVVEGLAETLSAPADPAAQADPQLLVGRCPLADVVVDDQAFSGSDAQFAYAWSAWAVSQIMASDPGLVPRVMADPGLGVSLDDQAVCGLR